MSNPETGVAVLQELAVDLRQHHAWRQQDYSKYCVGRMIEVDDIRLGLFLRGGISEPTEIKPEQHSISVHLLAPRIKKVRERFTAVQFSITARGNEGVSVYMHDYRDEAVEIPTLEKLAPHLGSWVLMGALGDQAREWRAYLRREQIARSEELQAQQKKISNVMANSKSPSGDYCDYYNWFLHLNDFPRLQPTIDDVTPLNDFARSPQNITMEMWRIVSGTTSLRRARSPLISASK